MKISKDSHSLVKTEFKSELKNIALFSAALIAFGLIAFLCGMNIYRLFSRKLIIIVSAAAILLGIIIFVYGAVSLRGRRRSFIKYIEEFAFGVEHTTKAAVLSFHDPMVVVSANGEIQWYNRGFAELCGRGSLFGAKIQELFPQIKLSGFLETKNYRQEFSYNGRDYMLSGTVSTTSDRESNLTLIGISFADISDIIELQKKFEEKKCVVCTAVIDNYDEVFKETPNSNHGAMMGDIERCVSLWVEKGEGFYRRYERDKFIILFEAAKFDILLREKFSVLNDVKEIDQQNKIPVTLSIGAGMAGDSLRENDKLSLSALDMALGRGGDQAVMKTANGFSFYGAKSLGVEKTTKVKARVVAKSLCNLIDRASKIIIMGHKNPDYDSFGAAVGLFRAVMDRNKSVYIAMDRVHNNVSDILSDLLYQVEYAEGIVSYDRAMSILDNDTLLIIVDTHRPGMVEYPELLKRAETIVLIDHHRRSEDFIDGAVLTYHEPYASSACEMVTEILQYIDDEQGLSVQEAEALYCGIYMDTKGFTFKTGARTFEAAAYLRKLGVDPVEVRRVFRNDLAMYIQKSKVISSAKVYRENIAIAVCEEPTKNVQLVVAQAADDLLNINGIEAAFVLAGTGSRIIISGRSLGAINVQVILEKLGGGGHITIAGAQLDNNSMTIAELKLRNAIDEILFDE